MRVAMYIADASISDEHRKSPWIEIPVSMHEMGMRVDMICREYEMASDLPFNVVKLGKTGSLIKRVLNEYISVSKYLKKIKPDVFIQVNLKTPLFIFRARQLLISKFLNGSKMKESFFILFLDWDGDFYEQGFGRRFKVLLHKFILATYSIFFDIIIVESECTKRSLSGIPLFKESKTFVLPHGYPSDIFKKIAYNSTRRERIVLCVARYSMEKNQAILIEAFKNICENFDEWTLHFIGKITNQRYYDDLRLKCENLFNRRIFLHVSLSEQQLENFYEKSSIFCLPSLKEGFAQVRIEAMSKGLPVITSEAGCGSDLEKMGALVFKMNDVKDLMSKLNLLMGNDLLRQEIADEESSHIYSYFQHSRLILSKLENVESHKRFS